MSPPVSSDDGHEGLVGVGIDLCSVQRIGDALGRTPGLSARLFTHREQRALEDKRVAGGDAAVAGAAAQMFAVKEAVMKSLGAGFDAVPFATVEVDLSGPGVALRAEGDAKADAMGVCSFVVDVELLDGPEGSAAVAEVLAVGGHTGRGPSS